MKREEIESIKKDIQDLSLNIGDLVKLADFALKLLGERYKLPYKCSKCGRESLIDARFTPTSCGYPNENSKGVCDGRVILNIK